MLSVRIAELIAELIGTYRRAIWSTVWYVSQSLIWELLRIAEHIAEHYLVRIAELHLVHLVRIAEIIVVRIAAINTHRRAICGTNWYVLQSYLWCEMCQYWYVLQSYLWIILVRIAELFVTLFGTYRRANKCCDTYRRACFGTYRRAIFSDIYTYRRAYRRVICGTEFIE